MAKKDVIIISLNGALRVGVPRESLEIESKALLYDLGVGRRKDWDDRKSCEDRMEELA